MDARVLGPGAAPRFPRELRDAEVLDDATAEGEGVRCVSSRIATDPMPWNPVSTPAGWYFPKRGDRAVLAYPVDGPPVILAFFPAAEVAPDVPS